MSKIYLVTFESIVANLPGRPYPSLKSYRAAIIRRLKKYGIKYKIATYDEAGNCTTCGEAGNCPGVHEIKEEFV